MCLLDAYSVVTAFAGWYQAHIARAHMKLSVMPALDTSRCVAEGKIPFKLDLVNNGIGPAVIDYIELTYFGTRYSICGDEFPVEIKNDLEKRNCIGSWRVLKTGSVCNVADVKTLLSISSIDIEENKIFLKEAVTEIKVYVKYSSLYRQTFFFTEA
jgi:hypothetical protein